MAIERCKPCANPHDNGNMPKYLPAGLTQYVFNIFPRRPCSTTSLKTTFQPPSNGWGWSRSPVISRYEGQVSSRCYTRRIGRNSPNLPGSEKLTSTSPAPTSCDIGSEPRTSTAKLTVYTTECESGRHSASSPAPTEKKFLAPGYACIPRADWLRRDHDTVRPKGAHFLVQGMVAWKNQREHYRGQGIPGLLSGRPETD